MIVPCVAIGCGLLAGPVNGALIAYTRIPPFIATLGMMVTARGIAKWWSRASRSHFPRQFRRHRQGLMPVIIFISLALLFS